MSYSVKSARPLPWETDTGYGLVGIGFPAKKMLTECIPSTSGVYSTYQLSSILRATIGLIASFRPAGSITATSITPTPPESDLKHSCALYRHYNYSDISTKKVLAKSTWLHYLFFTTLHGMQMRSCDEISVCLSVCPSNACIVTKRKKNLSRFLYHAKDHSV